MFGFWMISAWKKDGQRTAASDTSPHRPQPTQEFRTLATGSLRNGSGFG